MIPPARASEAVLDSKAVLWRLDAVGRAEAEMEGRVEDGWTVRDFIDAILKSSQARYVA